VFKADSLNYPNLMPIYKNNYSFVDLNSSFWIDVEAKTVHIHVKSKWLHGINQHFRYAVVVKEKTTKNNVMTNGETIFYDVYKASNMSEDINEINIKNPIKNQIDSFY